MNTFQYDNESFHTKFIKADVNVHSTENVYRNEKYNS